jgi:hypothetical protein
MTKRTTQPNLTSPIPHIPTHRNPVPDSGATAEPPFAEMAATAKAARHRSPTVPSRRENLKSEILRTGPNNSTFCVCAPLEDSTVTGEPTNSISVFYQILP